LVCTWGAVVATAVALLLVAEVSYSVSGCGSVDPTDPANYTSASLVNDTDTAVIVSDCRGGYCDPDPGPRRLGPGERMTIQGACGETGAAMTSWTVGRDDRSVVGFIAVGTKRSRTDVLYKVSMASPSRLAPTQPADEGTRTR
jgi:hypothetical protein